jgi:type IV pilus assembly protein PilY1
MNTRIRRAFATGLACVLNLTSIAGHAAVPTAVTTTPINAVPPNVQGPPARPVIMLNMSRDHQLFYRAYNEFTDYDANGEPDGTYIHTLRYSGYFDPGTCYAYSTANARFEPDSVPGATNLCTGRWHGNFLNWATMTRIDVLRKVLYGGTRSTDTATLTVLERASLPMDAHSFAKYYAGSNISGLTPFNETEITLCNTTVAPSGDDSQTTTQPPLLRAARGDYRLWNAHERRQCRWQEESMNGGSNGNDPAITGLSAGRDFPSRASTALAGGSNGDFTVRVQVCTGLIGSERCRSYGTSSKPIGLLQEYGDTDAAEFGLITGSFSRNVSGGVLRKNVSSFGNEINPADGTFVANVTGGGIVNTLDRLRVYGMRYSDNTYAANDNAAAGNQFCDFQTIGLQNDACASWGNPMGEMFIEALRYLRGNQGSGYGPTAAYGGGADAKGATMNLPVAGWVDPFTRGASIDSVFGPPQCRPINAIHFNASVTSYDRDDTAAFGDLGASGSLASYVNAIGTGEAITGTARFVGRNGSTDNNMCTAKNISALADADGLCPQAPAYRGSFSLAGAAYWANTHAIRPVPATLTGDDAARAYRVRSYAVALAPGVPRITVTAGAATAVIQPAYQLNHPSRGTGSGTLVDFRVIEQTATSGRYLVIWEDSEQGGDYDQDAAGILSWTLSGTTLTVTTRVYAESTGNPQGFGYTISGTNRDGVHFHSGIEGFNFTDVTGAPGCANCQVGQAATSATYTVTGGAEARSLQDPLWYAAKWGGFRNANGVPGTTPTADARSWDSVINRTGASAPNGDGVPDNYFEVFNPDQLEQSLRRVFQAAATASNAAPAVSSSELADGGYKYVASFNSTQLTGDLQAFQLQTDGSFAASATWSAGERLTAATTRQIISNDQSTGFAFTWAAISSTARGAYRTLMTTNATTPINDAQAERVVQFMRGDRTGEGTTVRLRNTTNIMGTVVNASPWLQGRPSARYFDSSHPGYSAFRTANATRTPVLWVAANDGMLHGFNADTGSGDFGNPIMSYVPESVARRLNETTTDTTVRAYVDGSPFSADVDLNAGISTTPDWRTYTFGALGRGGRGLYALNTTDVTALADAEANAGSIFRWQFTADDDADLGHILSDVTIKAGTGQPTPVAKLQDGRFALVVGNGYQSSSGRAALFILPVQGPGSDNSWTGNYHKIVLDTGTGNGLMTPTTLDTNNDGRVDTVYAGDLRGNLWKIDISDTNPANWRSAYLSGGAPTPLYVAMAADGVTRLPITGAPQFSFPPFGGVQVTFATGLSVVGSDFPLNARRQRIYGIWDRPDFAVSGGRALPRGISTLEPRTAARTSTGQVVITDGAAVDYTSASGAEDGWYFELPGDSEMVVSDLGVLANFVTAISIRPIASPTCQSNVRGALYVLDAVSGLPSNLLAAVTYGTGATYAPVAFDVADQRLRAVRDISTSPPSGGDNGGGGGCPAGYTLSAGVCVPRQDCPPGSMRVRFVGGGVGGIDPTTCHAMTRARLQWREIPGLRTR